MVLAVVAALLWRGSDAAATSSTTADAASVPDTAPAARLSISWSADTGPAPRRAVESGRALTTDAHGLIMRDPITGAEAWHYTRSNALLCDATAVNGLVIAVFRTAGRCDEAVALHAETGVRAWYRSVNFAEDVQFASTDGIVLAWAPSGLATLDPSGNNTRWRHAASTGCRLVGADVGSTGVVLLQRCPDADLQVQLLDGFSGSSTWTRSVDTAGAPTRLAGVDRLVDLVIGDRLQVLAPADGTLLHELLLPPLSGSSATREPLQQAGAADAALVWVRGTVYALDQTTGATRWQVPATGLPSVSGADSPTVLVPEDGALVQRSLADGTDLSRSVLVADLPAGGRTSVVGPAVVYATEDAVLGLR
ncbi:PQQ-like domain-containing protein [Modestobacter sp. DSM 44400]|nr:PQQ-like domain-containing protein [Modestobacter sp. DSM 44400]